MGEYSNYFANGPVPQYVPMNKIQNKVSFWHLMLYEYKNDKNATEIL